MSSRNFKTDISDISAAYNVENVPLEDQKTGTTSTQEIQKKADELDRLHATMKEKLKIVSYPEKIKRLTLVPDSWSRKFCSNYFDVSKQLVRTALELKIKGILAKPELKRGEKMPQ